MLYMKTHIFFLKGQTLIKSLQNNNTEKNNNTYKKALHTYLTNMIIFTIQHMKFTKQNNKLVQCQSNQAMPHQWAERWVCSWRGSSPPWSTGSPSAGSSLGRSMLSPPPRQSLAVSLWVWTEVVVDNLLTVVAAAGPVSPLSCCDGDNIHITVVEVPMV